MFGRIFKRFNSTASVSPRLFDKILIANRGEIACRVAQSARRLGVRSVAVYSDADANARHVQLADEAVRIGRAAASESYLRGERLLEVCASHGAQAVHPGYGFLSENADFARSCEAAGVVFIGPPAPAIDAMGSKSASKKIMSEANVPVVPGYHGEDQSVERFAKEAAACGYPVLIKAVLGGGGKGMRIVNDESELAAAMEASSREAVASFGDGALLIEKYVTRPRHIEFQVFADSHGNVVHLFERDCSVQRRYQKVIEEAPAPGMSEALRAEMGAAAVNAARAVNYVGAGTVEFIFDCDTDKFYFMEMNTRLQVEHPVTELITGQDLVEWQLRVASGATLPRRQDELSINGHAFEARIYAENPRANFLPHTGHLAHLSTPRESEFVRVDTGVRQGDDVSIFYDPMIAKLIVWRADRDASLRQLDTALADYQIAGLPTNIEFLRKVATHDAFVQGQVDTTFIEQYGEQLLPPLTAPPQAALAAAALYQTVAAHSNISNNNNNNINNNNGNDGNSVWSRSRGVRFNTELTQTVKLGDARAADDDMQWYAIQVREHTPQQRAQFAAGATSVDIAFDGADEWKTAHLHSIALSDGGGTKLDIELGGERSSATVVEYENSIYVFHDTNAYSFEKEKLDFGLAGDGALAGALKPPMPGKIVSVKVKEGDKVKKGDAIVMMEAMKMEHVIKAPFDGVIEEINVNEQDLVDDKKTLAVVAKE